VLTLQYDSIGHYGGNPESFGLQTWEVYRLNESITPGEDYFSDASFGLGSLLATTNFFPQVFDSVYAQGAMRRPHLRIRLDDALGQELLSPDSAIYENNTIFKSFLKGICIRPKAGTSNSAIVRFLPTGSMSKLTLFYTDSSGTARSYDYLNDSDAESTLQMEHNYAGTRVLENNTTDTVVYVQGINGVGVRLDFPFLDSLGEIIVNKAELYVYVAGEDDRNYPTPSQIFCLERKTDGSYLLVDDVSNSISRGSLNPYLIFGGTLKQDGDLRFFRMNISKFFQRLADNELDEKAVYIQTASVTDSGRMMLGNERSGTIKAKLYLTYTKIN
jgi:hypothetical protein